MFHPRGPTFWELARQALSSTEQGYDLLAPKFDYTPFRTPEPILQAAVEQVGGAGSVHTALDLCCGTGAALRAFRPLCREHITGVDFSAGMLEVARLQTPADPSAAAVHWTRQDVLEMTFHDAFDLAVCFGALGHFRPAAQSQFVARVRDALRPHGRFVFASTPVPSQLEIAYWLARSFNAAMHLRNALWRPPFVMFYLAFPVAVARQLLTSQGFTVEVRERVFPDPYSCLNLVIATRDS
ncbi:MAG: class I SAM-dependent methyltransferase [Pirellulaceae bacterium]